MHAISDVSQGISDRLDPVAVRIVKVETIVMDCPR